MVSNEGVGDAVRDGLRGANHSNSLAIARICNDADRPKPRPHTHEEIVNTFLVQAAQGVHCLIHALHRVNAQAGDGLFGRIGLGHDGGAGALIVLLQPSHRSHRR